MQHHPFCDCDICMKKYRESQAIAVELGAIQAVCHEYIKGVDHMTQISRLRQVRSIIRLLK